ncbi:MAG: hypothetical protein AAGE52_04095 [Myxococcota bacterium]
MNALNKWAGVLAAGMVASGCVTVEFEPIGGDVSVAGSWTINGAAADAISCDAAGIATVQLFVCDAIDGSCFDGAEINAPCANGAFNTGPLLVPDFYALQWAAFDASGFEVGRGGWQEVTALAGDTISTSVNFEMDMPLEGTLAGSWSINGFQADATTCADFGVTTIRLNAALDSAGADVFRSFDIPCANGSFDSRDTIGDPTLPAGTYYTEWFALDAGGAVLAQMTPPILLDTTVSTHADLLPFDFEIVVVNTLDVNILWEIETGGFGTCEMSGAAVNFGYFLFSSGGTLIAEDDSLGCANGLTFDDIASDTYTLELRADSADGVIKWGNGPAGCTGLVVEAGLEAYDCQVPIQ